MTKKMNKISLIFASGILLSVFSIGLIRPNSDVTPTPTFAETANDSPKVVIPDVRDFKMINTPAVKPKFVVDTVNQKYVSGGAWDSAFITDPYLDTSASSYSIKTHVKQVSPSILNDAWIGFAYYYNNDNALTFSVQWNQSMSTNTVNGAHFLGHINGVTNDRDNFQTATLPNGGYTRLPNNPFIDVWNDYGGWYTGNDRDDPGKMTVNMRTAGVSYVYLDLGFDITLYIDHENYQGRDAIIMQLEVGAYAGDKVTPKKFFTPKIAVDAFTQPNGVDGYESPFKDVPPLIGFYNHNCGDVEFSNFEYKNYDTTDETISGAKILGTEPDKFVVDNYKKEITINNKNFNTGFATLSSVDYDLNATEFSCDVKGTVGAVTDTAVGFSYFYDNNNYLLAYFNWDESVETIQGIHYLVTLNGVTENVYQAFNYPWDEIESKSFTIVEEFFDIWTDFGKVITDARAPSGVDNNFDTIRELSEITVASGFNMGISKNRKLYKGKLIDSFQMRVSAEGTDGKYHNFYSPTIFMDAFTYPKGSDTPSSFINSKPQIGVYVYQAGDVTFSNFKYGTNKILPKDTSGYVFGSHQEQGWTLTGSDMGHNWSIVDDDITETYEDIDPGTHYGEVTALYPNEEHTDFFIGASLHITKFYSNSSYIGIYPYYLDDDNYIVVMFDYVDSNLQLVVSGKIDGNYLGGQKLFYSEALDAESASEMYVEVELKSDYLCIYLENMPKYYKMFNLFKQDISHRDLTDSYVGFGIYNANGTFKDFKTFETSRIKPFTPGEDLVPSIVETGNRATVGYVNYTVNLPIYMAVNYLGELINCQVTVTSPSGISVVLEKNTFDFVPTENGKYEISVTATDEWEHSAKVVTYQIAVEHYVPYTPQSKYLWQSTFVLCFFGGLLALTAGLGVYLVYKNKKEAQIAEKLNQKNREKRDRELDGDEDE